MTGPFWDKCLGQNPDIRLGISTCLLGENVRYDGGHKRDRFLTNTLGQFAEWIPVCPEAETGLSVPREPMRLEGDPENPRLVVIKTGEDYTERMQTWARDRLEELAAAKLHGFVLKSRSPSCGLHVKVYDRHGIPSRSGMGIFSQELRRRFPLLPLEEDERLHNVRLRESFAERVFTYCRWICMLEEDPTPGGIVAFHTAHKMTILAHSPEHYRKMGRLVAQAGSRPWSSLVDRYGELLMEGLRVLTTPGRNANVLQHLLGFLQEHLSNDDKTELLSLIRDYRRGLIPLIVPLTLLKHYLNRHPVPDWMHRQAYLTTHPKKLMLRSHV